MSKKKKKEKPRTWWSYLRWLVLASLVVGACISALGALVLFTVAKDPSLPNIASLADYQPLQVTRVFSKDGQTIGEVYDERRTYVSLDAVPPLVVNAFVAAEDADFHRHEGIDYWGMLRAVIVNVKSGRKKQGASTITQQVVKTFLLSPERTYKRKLQEVVLARRLERSLNKDEILELYLNQIYFGHRRYGIQEAAKFYYGKDVSELNIGEAAMLAALPKAPENISPKKERNKERAKNRQTYVLQQMVEHGYLDKAEADTWIAEPLVTLKNPFPSYGIAPEWVDMARRQLEKQFGVEAISSLGARVTTTLDTEVQKKAQAALEEGLRAVDATNKYGRALDFIRPSNRAAILKRYSRKRKGKPPLPGKSYKGIVTKISDEAKEMVVDLGGWKGSVILGEKGDSRYNPEGLMPSKRFRVGDAVLVRLSDRKRKLSLHTNALRLSEGPQGAVVIIRPEDRHVIAMVGGYNMQVADFNRATMAKRQPGSTFKPIAYAAAIRARKFTAGSIVNDVPDVYNDVSDKYKPQNYTKGEYAGPVRLRTALARSINTVAIRVVNDVGPGRVADVARLLGIRSRLPETLSLALGAGEVTLLELTNAFASFVNLGKTGQPQFLHSLNGTPINTIPQKQGISPQVAYIVLDMMRSVVRGGTASKASALGLDVAGKTGTSNDGRDAWFVGLTPEYSIGVWIGFDDYRPIGRGATGGKAALPVFISIAKALGLEKKRFTRPSGLSGARIDKKTGLLAAPGVKDSTSYMELFLPGTAPSGRALAPDKVDPSTFHKSDYE